jgi:2-polyprenyl-6-methoxyphenol hydroxylase-like FAD-dependent oxidoreductase
VSIPSHYDVAIVGASLAGCTAARLFGQQGLKVALIEQHPALHGHKRLCTHYIQASAVGTVQRIGLEPLIEAAGGVRSRLQIWSPSGWIRHAPNSPLETYGYSIRRQTLDPILRRLAVDTPGVELLLGWKACQVLRENDRVSGLMLRDIKGLTRELTARLVVAADGRNSTVAKLAQVAKKTSPNNRFTYYAYYRNLPLVSGNDSQLWQLDPDVAYALVCDAGLTLLCGWMTKDRGLRPVIRSICPRAPGRARLFSGGTDLSAAGLD